MEFLEKTIKVIRNGLTHQIPLGLTGRRYFGGGDSDIEFVDPLQGTGVRELFKQLSDFVGPQIGKGLTPFPGTTVADPTQLQTQGFQAAGGLSPLATGSFDVFGRALRGEAPGQGTLNLGTQGLQDVFQPFDPTATQERFEANLEPAFNLFRDRVLPAIEEAGVRRTGSGSAGGTQREIRRAGVDFATNQNAILANSLFGAEQAHLDRQTQGISQAGNLAGIPGSLINQAGQTAGRGTDLLTQGLNIGGVQRGIESEGLQEALQKWLFSQPFNNPIVQNFLGTALSEPGFDFFRTESAPGIGSQLLPSLGAFAGTESGSESISGLLGSLGGLFGGGGGSKGGSPFGGLGGSGGGEGFLGGGSDAADIAQLAQIAFMFSDIRVKENIKPVENALDKVEKLSGYTYNYTFNDPEDRTGGIMAQDIEKVLPEAVKEVNGVKMVEYTAVVALLINAVNELREQIVRSN